MSVITTIKTDCKDCYKCVRSCPMKAIQITKGQASIVEERCINDGNCINACPQGAKQIRKTDLELVRQWLKKKEKIAVSLAPSYPAGLNFAKHCEIIRILRALGFAYIQETALAAEYVTKRYLELLESDFPLPLITSCCPVIIDLVEKHYSHLIPHLAPVLSPMALHGKMLKEKFTKVVFIGPCIAKKEEMEYIDGYIDAVLTFSELEELISETKEMSLESDMFLKSFSAEFDGEKAAQARLFPLGGGLLRTAGLSTDILADEYLTITGLEETIEFFDEFPARSGLKLIEILACQGGCIGGVGVASKKSLFKSRENILGSHCSENKVNQFDQLQVSPDRSFKLRSGNYEIPPEDEIKKILLLVGKSRPEDELNCGCCGYNSCREKAIAVYNGLAEVEMCLPYMRSKAESFSNLILHSTPNGVVVVDNQLKVVEVNPAFEKMFQIKNEAIKGNDISLVVDETKFSKVYDAKNIDTDLVHYSNSLIIRQSIFFVEKSDLVIGIFTDVTREELQKNKLASMREETFVKAQEVIDKQMRVAQEIAGLLGETTAETKVTLTRLMGLLEKK